jgi:hypothetical protein
MSSWCSFSHTPACCHALSLRQAVIPQPKREPTALAEWATHKTEQLPLLAPALRRLLEELPAAADGLSGRNDERSKRSPPARTHHRPPSSEHNDSSRPPSSATLVLLSPLNARAGRDQAARNRRRRAASPAAPARRQPALRTPPAAADSNRRMHAPRRSRSSRTARHRRLDRRHAHHVRQHLAMGFDAAQARSTISTLGESGMPRLLPRAIE